MTRLIIWDPAIGDRPANLALTNNFDATTNPGVNNDISVGYTRGSVWINQTNDEVFMCTDQTKGAALWELISTGSSTPGQVVAPAASTPTGAGSAAGLVGGAGGTTSGSGGAAAVTGGAGTAGNANGGSAVISGGAPNGTGVAGSVRELGVVLRAQPAQATQDTAVTLTAAQLLTGIIQSTPAGAINLTLPLQAAMDTAIPDAANNDSFDFSVINTSAGANTITVLANSWTTVGVLTIAQNVAARFRARKTGAGAWTLYRIS